MSIFNVFRKTGAPQEGERVEPSAGGTADPADAGAAPQGPAQDAPWVTVNPETGEIGGAAVPPQASSTVSFGFGAEVKTPVDEAPAGAPSGTAGKAGASAAAASASSSSPASPAFRPWNPYGGDAQNAQAAVSSASADSAAVEREEAAAASVATDLPEVSAAAEPSPEASEPAAQPAGASAAASSGASSAFTRGARAFEAPPEEPVETPIDKPVPREKAVAPQRTKKIVLEVPSDEELLARRRTRHRLVGAAALLMALVVAAPFVLDSEKDYEQVETIETAIPLPPAADAPLEVEDPQGAPAEDLAADAASAEKPAKAEVVATTIDPKPAKKPAEVEQMPAPKPAPKPEAAKSEAKPAQSAAAAEKPLKSVGIEPPTGEGFYIQVMATSSEREAEKVVKRLAMLGLPAYRMPVEKKATTLWRVRVGLYKTKKEAEGAVGTIVLNSVVQGQPIVGRQ